jgi:hypothetical protein
MFLKIHLFILLICSSFWIYPVKANKQMPSTNVLPRFFSWKSYNLSDEGNYVLRLRNESDIPIKDLITNLHVYIPSSSFLKEQEDYSNHIFIPSTGEYLVEIDLLKLLQEEGFNISLRSHSFIYLISHKKIKTTNLEVYKIGPAKPFLSYDL